jgi:hypothetical protein
MVTTTSASGATETAENDLLALSGNRILEGCLTTQQGDADSSVGDIEERSFRVGAYEATTLG